ncbi:hypothetical protein CH50_08385, partial [Paenibacillus darwinianus]
VAGGTFQALFRLPEARKLRAVWVESSEGGQLLRADAAGLVKRTDNGAFELVVPMAEPGERKLVFELDNGKTDFVVFNVMEPVKEIIEARTDYICRNLYQDENAEAPHAFLPLSNQGESLGKLNLVLMKNLMGDCDADQVRKVENSAVFYMKTKWFENGDFYRPAKLYGDGGFYRIIDFDYVAHVYYLLSKFQAGRLIIKDLLQDLARHGMSGLHERLSRLWKEAGERLRLETGQYKGAVTEHFYDNAGFGPTCEALCLLGYRQEAKRYGALLLANIGFSNDFRAQNPDRWWESLSYMIHSLWGGMVSASALVAYEHLRDPEYLKAAYRAAVPVFYCYDWHASATNKKLERGQAASTYSVAGPNLNRPDLSRNRFGQSVFAEDGGLFAELFGNASGDDWDMGEELAAYLAGFGTKTYLYYQDGEVRCVNGEIVKRGDRYEVTSYAAYPSEFHFYDANSSFQAAPGEEVRTVVFEDGRFIRPLLNVKGNK